MDIGEPAGHLATRSIHGGLTPDPETGAILTPVYQTATFVQEEVGKDRGYTYSRSGNPTIAALERNLGAVEGCGPFVVAPQLGQTLGRPGRERLDLGEIIAVLAT